MEGIKPALNGGRSYRGIIIALVLAFVGFVLTFFVPLIPILFALIALVLLIIASIKINHFQNKIIAVSIIVTAFVITLLIPAKVVYDNMPKSQKSAEEVLMQDFKQELNKSDQAATEALGEIVMASEEDTVKKASKKETIKEVKKEMSDEEKARILREAADKALEDPFKELEKDKK